MKNITTELINKPAKIEEIEKIINNLLYSHHKWLVLSNTDDSNYIQVFAIDNEYMIEYRKYDFENFEHYRLYTKNSDKIQNYFKLFFDNEKISVNSWENVTKEFKKKSIFLKFFEFFKNK